MSVLLAKWLNNNYASIRTTKALGNHRDDDCPNGAKEEIMRCCYRDTVFRGRRMGMVGRKSLHFKSHHNQLFSDLKHLEAAQVGVISAEGAIWLRLENCQGRG